MKAQIEMLNNLIQLTSCRLQLFLQTKFFRQSFLRITAWSVLIAFTTTQTAWGQELVPASTQNGQYQLTKALDEVTDEDVTAAYDAIRETADSLHFLGDQNSLSPSSEQLDSQPSSSGKLDLQTSSLEPETSYQYEYERYDFENALEQLRPEYASAVIVKSLTKENIETLESLSFETGIAVIHGEIVLFTSGNQNEIKMLSSAKSLLENADLIAHTHVSSHAQDGPSIFDIESAVEDPKIEYVLSSKGVYAYNRSGKLYGGKPLGYEVFISDVNLSVDQRGEQDQTLVRGLLNKFIFETDRLNESPEEEKDVFRKGDSQILDYYDGSGNLTMRIVKNFYDDGSLHTYQKTNWQAGVKYYYEFDEYQPNGTLSKTNIERYDSSAGWLRETDDRLYENGILSSRINRLYQSDGHCTQVLEETYYGNGLKNSSDRHQFTNGIPYIRYYSTFHVNGQYQTWGIQNYFSNGNTQKIDQYTYDTAGQTTARDTIRYFDTGVLESTDYWTYAGGVPATRNFDRFLSNGQQAETKDETYYSNGKLNIKQTYQFVNGLPSIGYRNSYYDTGIYKTSAIDNFYSDGAVRKINEYSYSSAGQTTARDESEYYADGTLQKQSYWTYLNGVMDSYGYEMFDASGNYQQVQNIHYYMNGLKSNVETVVYSNAKKNVRYFTEYSDNGQTTSTMTEQFYTSEKLKSRDEYHYLSGVLSGRHYLLLSAEGLYQQDLQIEYFSNGYEKVKNDKVYVSGYLSMQTYKVLNETGQVLVSHTAEFVSVPVTTRQEYDFTYRLDGVDVIEPVTLSLGANLIERTAADGMPLAYTVTLKEAVDDAIVILSEVHARTNQSSITIQYEVNSIVKDKTFELNEGGNTLAIVEKDAEGNDLLAEVQVELDTTGPVIELVTQLPSLTNQRVWNIQYRLDGVLKEKSFLLQEGSNALLIKHSDDLANETTLTINAVLDTIGPAVEVLTTIPAKTNQPSLTIQYNLDGVLTSKTFNLQENLNTIEIRHSDALGNETLKTWSITLDTQPPVIEIVSAVPARTNNNTLTVNYKLDGVAKTKVFSLSEGNNSVTISHSDDAGNVTAKNYTVVLDTTGPEIIAVTQVPGRTNQTTLTIQYTLDGVSQSKAFQLNEGDNTLTIDHQDDLGNHSIKVWTVELDTQGPVINVTSSVPAKTNSAQLTVEYMLDGIAQSKIFNLEEGSNDLEIRHADDLGNETVVNLAVERDTQGPAIVITNTVPENTNQTELTVEYTLDGIVQIKTFGLSEGLNTIEVRHSDELGNETVKSWTVLRDQEAPSGSVAVNSGNAHANQREVTLALTAEDTASGIESVRFAMDEQPESWSDWESFTSSKTYTLSEGDGEKQVLYEIKDKAGNITRLSDSIILDTQSPEIEVLSGSIVNVSDYELIYISDGIEKRTVYTLAEGENLLSIDESDAAGNHSHIDFPVTYIYNGEFELGNGTVLLYENGQVVREMAPDATVKFLGVSGNIETYQDALGHQIRYNGESPYSIELYDADGNLIETLNQPAPSFADRAQALKVVRDGIESYYQDGELKELVTQTGIRITDFILDEENNIQQALMIYPDKTTDVIRGGVLLRRIHPDGSFLDQTPDGMTVREIMNGTVEYFSYEKILSGGIGEVRAFTSQGESVSYDTLGILSSVQDADGNILSYVRHDILASDGSGVLEGYRLILEVPAGTELDAKTMVEAFYSPEGKTRRIIFHDGTTVEFNDNQQIKTILDTEGKQTGYDYLEVNGFAQGLNVSLNDTDLTYDQDGFLSQIKTASGTIERVAKDENGDGVIQDDELDLILKFIDGNVLSNFELDSDGNILEGLLTTKEGIKQRIENGVLTGYETVDGKVYEMQEDRAVLTEWKFKDGTRVVYGGGKIDEVLFPNGNRLHTIGFSNTSEVKQFVEEDADGTQKFFENNKLVKLITAEGNTIHYDVNGLAFEIVLADLPTGEAGGAVQKVGYVYNEDGSVKEARFYEPHMYRTFDADGHLKDLLSNGVSAQIENDEITKLFTRFGEINHPEWNQDSQMSGDIVYADGTIHTLLDGVLVKSVRPDGTVVEYADGRVYRITMGDSVYQLIYGDSLEGTDESGSLQNPHIKLLFVEGTPEYPLIPYLLNPETFYQDPAANLLGRDIKFIGGAHIDENVTKTGGGAIALDGTGDYVEVADSTDWDFGTGDFTIDAWVNFDSVNGGYPTIASKYLNGNGWIFSIEPYWGDMMLYNNGWNRNTVRYGHFEPNQWYHVAVERAGDVIKFFVNGMQVGDDLPAAAAYDGIGNNLWVGAYDSNYLPGLIDQVRISKGIARWSENFDPEDDYEADDNLKLFLPLPKNEAYEEKLNILQHDSGLLSEILNARDLFDAFENTREVSSVFEQGEAVQFVSRVQDNQRGEVYEFGHEYFPSWLNVDIQNQIDRNLGYINRFIMLDSDDNLPVQTADFIDMNGDELPDRVFMDQTPGVNYWWVQWNNGQGFDAPQKWEGIEWFDAYWMTNGKNAMRLFEGRQPHVLGDLFDINGDGRPDRVFQNIDGSPEWYVQINNGHGFEPSVIWEGAVHALSLWSFQGKYASEVRNNEWHKDVQELIADMVDLDGDGLLDRVIRPYVEPFTHWFFQKNTGSGFEDAVLWDGVDNSFYPGSPSIGGSLSWYDDRQQLIADFAGLYDMNGDNLPDRVLLKNSNPLDTDSAMEWYVQFNTGSGFDEAVLWDDNVRALPGAPYAKSATAITAFRGWNEPRSILITLRDVTGDGLPDRITVDQDDANAQTSWWVEVNTGTTFADAVEWTGIYGTSTAETSIGQDFMNFRSNPDAGVAGPHGRSPGYVTQTTDLQDINGDGILDRVIFPVGNPNWLIQFGTGSGFLPVEEMQIEGLQSTAPEEINTIRYDSIHVGLKSEQNMGTAGGAVRIQLRDPNDAGSLQEWTITGLTTEWQDFYLPLDAAKPNASQIKIEYLAAAGGEPMAIYVDDLTFTSMRPDASFDWLDRMLAESNVLAEIHSDRTQTLSQYLGLREAENAGDFDWERLLNAEVRIDFNESSEVSEFENAYGTVSRVENNRVVESTLLDGTVIHFDPVTDPAAPANQTTQTITRTDGTTETVKAVYGRVREVTGADGSTLQYSYEYTAAGDEITVVYDQASGKTERYRDFLIKGTKQSFLISRTEANGITTQYTYNPLGDLIKSEIVYKGRVRQTFIHGVSQLGHSTLTTEDGTVEEYDADGQIIAHTSPEGYRYSHDFGTAKQAVTSYQTETLELPDGTMIEVDVPVVELVDCTENCEDIHRVTLDSYTAETGEYAEYEDGLLKSLTLPASSANISKVTISFDEIETQSSINSETGLEETQTTLMDATVMHEDGTITEFRSGKPYSVTSAGGRVINLQQENGLFINPNESAVFHYEQAQKLWNETVLAKWNAFQLSDSLAIHMEYDMDGALLVRQYAEGVTEIYEDGHIRQILAKDNERLIHYDYDDDGNIVKIDMEGSRRRLDTAVIKLRAEISVENEKAMATIADREQVLSQTVEGEYITTRDNLLRKRRELEDKKQEIGGISVKGKQARGIIGNALSQIQGGIDQINRALDSLARQRQDALEQLTEQVAQASADLEIQTEDAYRRIDNEEVTAKHGLSKQELIPVINHWYREIMGREASDDDFAMWLPVIEEEVLQEATEEEEAKVRFFLTHTDFSVDTLKDYLLNSQEYSDRQAEVNAIKTTVKSEIDRYLGLSEAEQLAFAQALGIDSDVIASISKQSLNVSEADAIKTWIDSQTLHFGQSAFLSLEALLQNEGIAYTRIDLAVSLILIDVLTGTITPLEQGDLILSLYAMRAYASTLGIDLQASKMSYDALKALVEHDLSATGEARIVVHIDKRHYIIVTGISQSADEDGNVIEEVTYIDPSAGREGNLQQFTITKEDFLKKWLNSTAALTSSDNNTSVEAGYVLSARGPPQEYAAQARELTVAEQMQVRGAFFGLIVLAVVAIAQAVVAAVAAVVAAIVTLIAGIVAGIGSILGGIGSFFGGILSGNFVAAFQGLFTGILNGLVEIGAAFINAAEVFTTTFVNVSGLSGTAVGNAVTGAGLVGKFTTALVVGFELQGLGYALRGLGLSPKIAGTITAGAGILTGVGAFAAAGLLNSVGTASALGFVASGTADLLSLHTNLSPGLSSVISIGASALSAFAGGFTGIGEGLAGIGAGIDALKSILPDVLVNFAGAGLTAVGNSLGWNPKLTSLLTIPVHAAVDGLIEGFNNSNILNSVKDAVFSGGTLGGLVSVGANIGLTELGAPPIASNFISSFLSQVAAGFVASSSGEGSPGGIKERTIFDRISDGISKFAHGAVQAVGNVVSLGAKVIEGVGSVTVQGVKNAVRAFSGIFSRQTQDSIYADEMGLRNAEVSVDGDNWTWKSGDTLISYISEANQTHESFGIGGTANIISLGQDEAGHFSYSALDYQTVSKELGGATLKQAYENGQLQEWGYYYGDIALIEVSAGEGDGWVTDDGWLNQSEVKIYDPIIINVPDDSPTLNLFSNFSFNFSIFSGKVAEASVEAKPASTSEGQTNLRLDKNLYVATNGIGYDPDDASSNYMENLRLDLFGQSHRTVDPIKDVIVAPTFALSGFLKDALNVILGQTQATQIIQKVKNVLDWYQTQKLGGVTDDVFKLRQSIKDLAEAQGIEPFVRGMVGVGYSGGFAPIVHALSNGEFIPKSFVALGGTSAWVGSKLAEILANVIESFEQLITARDDNVRALIKTAVGLLSALLTGPLKIAANTANNLIKGLDLWYDLNDKQALDAKVAEFYQDLQLLIAPQFGYNWDNLASSNANAVVNIYGDKDPLTIGNLISGHLDELGGYRPNDDFHPLFNIEIKDANHFDYINGVHDYSDPQDITRNEIVSKFVAQVILNSATANDLVAFLTSKPVGVTITQPDPNSFNFVIDFGF